MRNSLFIILLVLLVSCSADVNHNGKTPVAEVDDNYLYLEDIKGIVPLDLSGDDSVKFVDDYIRKWAEDIVFYDKAKSNLVNEKSINEYVENYRRNLIVNEYQERLVREKLNADISDSEIRKYYDSDRNMFILDYPLVKGVYVKVPVNNREIKTVRRYMNFKHETDRDRLESFTLRGAADYSYFMGNWEDLTEITQKLPKTVSNGDFEAIGHLYEFKDSAYVYMFYVDSLIPKGGYMPYEVAYNDIREVIYNERKATYIKEVRKDLYDRALEKKKIKVFR